MSKRKKTRHHSKWKIDSDYKATLSPELRAYLEKFEDEFYRADGLKDEDDPLHESDEKRRELYRAQNAAARDLMTAHADAVASAVRKAAKSRRPCHKSRHYEPTDYLPGAAIPEDRLIDLLDLQSRFEEADGQPARADDLKKAQ